MAICAKTESRKYVAVAIIVAKCSLYYKNAKRDQTILEADGWLPQNPEIERCRLNWPLRDICSLNRHLVWEDINIY